MSSNHLNTKKRKAGDDGSAPSAMQLATGEGGLVDELREMKSAMKALVDHGRLQMEKMDVMTDKLNHLETQNDLLHAKNNSLEKSLHEISDRQKYHEVLLKYQKWEYPVPRPPQSYWDSIQHDQDHVDAATSFLEVIEEVTCHMRHGIESGEEAGHVMLGIDDYLPYNDVFLPHWKEFANALEEYQYCLKCLPQKMTLGDGSMFCLGNIQLPSAVLDLLSNALRSTHFEQLGLSQNDNSGGDILDFALTYAQRNPILKGFGLDQKSIDNADYLRRICDMIRDHPALESFFLSDCTSEEISGNEILHSIITAGRNKLKDIYLKDNDISTEGSTFLSDFLASNPVLQQLNLSKNQLNDTDATLIANALKRNTNLHYLDLERNPITRDGCEALRKTEFDNTSLNSVADSNHTCRILYPNSDTGFNDGAADSYEPRDTKSLRAKKIYSVFSLRNRECSNVQHFDDVPVEFLPDLLDSIQKYSEYHIGDNTPDQDDGDVKPLSVVYEVMRGWDKAFSVYEAISN